MSPRYPVDTRRQMTVLLACCLLFIQPLLAQPVITSVTPTVGPGKMQLTITGHNFSPYAGHNLVNFGATQGIALLSGTDTLRVMAPYSTSYQPITVWSDGLTGIASQSYDQTFSNGGVPFSAGSFGAPVNYATDGNALSVYDLNLDGKPEIISSAGNNAPQFAMRSFSVMTNTGGGGTLSFNTQHFPQAKSPYYCVPADLDGDTWADLVTWDSAADGSCEITVYKNSGPGAAIAFAPGVSSQYGTHPTSQPRKLLLQDFDGDGQLDILTDQLRSTGGPQGQFYLIFLRNEGGLHFKDSLEFVPTSPSGSFPGSLGDYNTADLDGDGKPDLVVKTGSVLYFYRNVSTRGNIAFAPSTVILTSVGAGPYFKLADIDGDGKNDFVSLDGESITVQLNTGTPGNPSFGPQNIIATGSIGSELALGDLDGDGRPDVVVSNQGDDNISVLRNTGSRGTVSFDAKVNYSTTDANYTFSAPFYIHLTDLDGDQRPEIIVSDGTVKRVTVFQNRMGLSPAPTISGITPNAATAGQPVGIKGANFTGALYVSFGGVPASSFTVVGADSIIAIPAGGATGKVAVTTRGGSDTLAGFTYLPASKPTITAFSPASAKFGDTVRVMGTHFITAQSLTFGGVPATYFNVANDSLLLAVVGMGQSGSVAVRTTGGVDSLSGFVYTTIQPVISSFIPTSGKPLDTVLVWGAHFASPAVTGVSFGGVASPYFHVLNDSVLYALVSPDGASGAVAVSNGLVSGSLAGFTFIRPAPVVRTFYPNRAHSGDTVVIRGSNLTGATIVQFGGTNAARFVVEADSVVMATVGNGATGEVAVFTSKGSDSIGTFTYLGAADTTKPAPPDTTRPVAPAAFKLVSYGGALVNGQAVLVWVAQHDSSILSYTIQEGSDSTALVDVAAVASKRLAVAGYAYTDPEVRSGKTWYRLIMVDTASRRIDGPFLPVTFVATQATGIFPNPAVGVMTALIPNPAVASQFELADANGRVLMVIPVAPGNTSMQVNLSGLNPGTYRLTWSDGHRRTTKTVLILK